MHAFMPDAAQLDGISATSHYQIVLQANQLLFLAPPPNILLLLTFLKEKKVSGQTYVTPILGGAPSISSPDAMDELYEPRPNKRFFRVLTVIGYMFSISFGKLHVKKGPIEAI